VEGCSHTQRVVVQIRKTNYVLVRRPDPKREGGRGPVFLWSRKGDANASLRAREYVEHGKVQRLSYRNRGQEGASGGGDDGRREGIQVNRSQ